MFAVSRENFTKFISKGVFLFFHIFNISWLIFYTYCLYFFIFFICLFYWFCRSTWISLCEHDHFVTFFVTEMHKMMTFWWMSWTMNEDEWCLRMTRMSCRPFLGGWGHFAAICLRSRSELREYPRCRRGTVAHVFLLNPWRHQWQPWHWAVARRRGVVHVDRIVDNSGWLYGDWINIWISFITPAIRMLRLDPVNVCVPLSLTFHLMQSPGQKWAHVAWEFWDNGGSVVSAVPSPHTQFTQYDNTQKYSHLLVA